MREAESTTRERIADHLRGDAASAATIATEFEVTAAVATDHVRHVARSLEHTDEELLVAPPECADCGFEGFDDPLNRPSRCPECKGESVRDPEFTIR
jgi:hypothetical protein